MWSLVFHVCLCCHTDRSRARILLTFDLGCWCSSDMRYTLCSQCDALLTSQGWWRLRFLSTSVTKAWMNSSNAAVGVAHVGTPRGWLGLARRNFSFHVKTQLHFFMFITFISPFFSFPLSIKASKGLLSCLFVILVFSFSRSLFFLLHSIFVCLISCLIHELFCHVMSHLHVFLLRPACQSLLMHDGNLLSIQ